MGAGSLDSFFLSGRIPSVFSSWPSGGFVCFIALFEALVCVGFVLNVLCQFVLLGRLLLAVSRLLPWVVFAGFGHGRGLFLDLP